MKSFKDLREKTLTPAEKKKREEIAKAMERDNPGMDMSKKMAIATATAKKVAEASKSDMLCKECGDQFGKPTNEKCMYDAYDQSGKNWVTKEMYEGLDITEISLNMLTKKISNSGMTTTKKANKVDKTKDDLAALKARLAGKPAMAKEAYEDNEPASPDEASMAMRQLGFIEYAAEEVMDHIKSGKEFPEWMQNKLSKLHGQMESLHSALGEHGEDDEDEMKEATELDELNKKTLGSYIKKASGSAAGIAAVTSAQAAIKGKSNPDDRRQLRNRLTGISRATDKVTKEEVDEAKRKGAPKMTGDSFAIQRAKDAELNKALGRTKTGRKKPARQMTSTQRSLASLRNEAVVSADKKPEKFVKPDGTVGIRMARVDKQVIKKDA